MKYLLVLLIVVGITVSCHQIHGSGNIITDIRHTGSFRGIDVGGAFEVELKNGSPTTVDVEADDNIIDYIETTVKGDILEIRSKDHTGFTNGHFKVFITTPEINSIHVSGAAEMKSVNAISCPGRLKITASGSANITAQLDAPEVYTNSSGASTIHLSGKTRNYSAECSGSSEMETGELLGETTEVKSTGASSAQVYSSLSLKAEALGSSSIEYRGGGNVVKKMSGAASVEKEEE